MLIQGCASTMQVISWQFKPGYVRKVLRRFGIRVVSAVGRFGRVVSAWVVSALFWGESIRPSLVGRFGRESFRPWVVLASLNID